MRRPWRPAQPDGPLLGVLAVLGKYGTRFSDVEADVVSTLAGLIGFFQARALD